jgi:hypothetical protein
MKSAIVSLTRMVGGIALLTTSLHAALIFTAGSGKVTPGGLITVPIVASGSSPDWVSAQFTLVWDSGVLTIDSFVLGGLLPSAAFAKTTGVFSWFDNVNDPPGVAVSDPYTMLSVTFKAATDAPLGPYTISFSTPEVGFAAGPETPFTVNGSIEVVPEPVNWALGLFACVFTGAATVRWISVKRKSSQAG